MTSRQTGTLVVTFWVLMLAGLVVLWRQPWHDATVWVASESPEIVCRTKAAAIAAMPDVTRNAEPAARRVSQADYPQLFEGDDAHVCVELSLVAH